MSRGHGKVQQQILEAARHGGVYPLIYIAQVHGYDVTALPVRQSFARAARKLAGEGLIDLYDRKVPTARSELTGDYLNNRDITCITLADNPITEESWAACWRMAFGVYFPDTHEQLGQYQQDQQDEPEWLDRIAGKVLGVLSGDEEITRERVVKLLAANPASADHADAIADRVMELIV